ncbi:MAG: hypothetical protein WCI41_00080 [bacterium]
METTIVFPDRKKSLKKRALNLIISKITEDEFHFKTNCGGKALINTSKLNKEQNGFNSYDFIFIKSKLFIVVGIGKSCSGINSSKEDSIFLLEEYGNGVCCWGANSLEELEKHHQVISVL